MTITAEPTTIQVGTVLDTRDLQEQVPVGGVIERISDPSRKFRKIEHGGGHYWRRINEQGVEFGVRRPITYPSIMPDTLYRVASLPGQTTPAHLVVGYGMETNDDFILVPRGTVIRYRESGSYYVKTTEAGINPDEWYPSDPEGEVTDSRSRYSGAESYFIRGGLNTIFALPQPVVTYDGPQVGDRLRSREMYEALPIGAEVRGTYRYRKVSDTHMVALNGPSEGQERPISGMATRGGVRVTRLPECEGTTVTVAEAEPVEPLTEPGEDTHVMPGPTLAQFQQRFRTFVIGSAQRSGIDMDPVIRALTALEVPEFEWGPGAVIHASHRNYGGHDDLPDGTVTEPLRYPRGCGPWAWIVRIKQGSDMTTLLGRGEPYGEQVIRHIENTGPASWQEGVGTDEDADAIRDLRQRAWSVGCETKRTASWCGEFENVFARMNLHRDGSFVDAPSLERIDAEQCASLPVGTILRYTRYDGETRLYRRDDRAINPAKTVAIGGSLGGEWASEGMVIVHDVTSRRMSIPVASASELASMPVGTRITDGSRDGWTKRPDQMWDVKRAHREGFSGYNYSPEQFVLSEQSIVFVP